MGGQGKGKVYAVVQCAFQASRGPVIRVHPLTSLLPLAVCLRVDGGGRGGHCSRIAHKGEKEENNRGSTLFPSLSTPTIFFPSLSATLSSDLPLPFFLSCSPLPKKLVELEIPFWRRHHQTSTSTTLPTYQLRHLAGQILSYSVWSLRTQTQRLCHFFFVFFSSDNFLLF